MCWAGKKVRLAFWSKSLQNVVTGKERWPSTKVLFCFRWDCVSAGAPLKTARVCRMNSFPLCHLTFSWNWEIFFLAVNSLRALLTSQAGPWGCPLFLSSTLSGSPANEAWPLSLVHVDSQGCHAGSLGTCVGHWVSRSVSGQCVPPENWVRQNTHATED